MSIGVTGETMQKSVMGLGSLMGLGASSIIVIIAISPEINGTERNVAIYALVISIMTLFVVAACSMMSAVFQGTLRFGTLALFAAFWVVLACLTTFRGPFTTTSNGYFGSWAGAVTSVFATMAALKSTE